MRLVWHGPLLGALLLPLLDVWQRLGKVILSPRLLQHARMRVLLGVVVAPGPLAGVEPLTATASRQCLEDVMPDMFWSSGYFAWGTQSTGDNGSVSLTNASLVFSVLDLLQGHDVMRAF